MKTFNNGLRSLNPGCFTVAEDSTSLAGCTVPVEDGGLGFDYKWDMGWMHDTLELFQTPPRNRQDAYHKLTFSMAYFANERYLLPLSHDEVVHGKATIAQKMAAKSVEDKLAQARALYLYMFAHPGKKLNFMGWEVAQLREWDERREQDWFMRRYPAHDAFYRFACELGALYRDEAALWELDYDDEGFVWVEANDTAHVTYAFVRRDASGGALLCALNLSDEELKRTFGLDGVASAMALINTDWRAKAKGRRMRQARKSPCEKSMVKLNLPTCTGPLVRLEA